jgi:hypothetical protein
MPQKRGGPKTAGWNWYLGDSIAMTKMLRFPQRGNLSRLKSVLINNLGLHILGDLDQRLTLPIN